MLTLLVDPWLVHLAVSLVSAPNGAQSTTYLPAALFVLCQDWHLPLSLSKQGLSPWAGVAPRDGVSVCRATAGNF